MARPSPPVVNTLYFLSDKLSLSLALRGDDTMWNTPTCHINPALTEYCNHGLLDFVVHFPRMMTPATCNDRARSSRLWRRRWPAGNGAKMMPGEHGRLLVPVASRCSTLARPHRPETANSAAPVRLVCVWALMPTEWARRFRGRGTCCSTATSLSSKFDLINNLIITATSDDLVQIYLLFSCANRRRKP